MSDGRTRRCAGKCCAACVGKQVQDFDRAVEVHAAIFAAAAFIIEETQSQFTACSEKGPYV